MRPNPKTLVYVELAKAPQKARAKVIRWKKILTLSPPEEVFSTNTARNVMAI